jgi:flagellar basal-body rod protein FlgG
MVNGLYTARNGMMLLQEMVDNTSNNLANANTSGFKKALMASISEVQNKRNDENKLHHDESHWMSESRINWEQGSFIDTQNPMDIAIQGNGFLSVETPEGVRYTRSGNLTRNGVGELVTLQGYKVLDQGGNPIVVQGENFQVSSSGTINVNGQAAGRLAVVDFADRTQLQREGRNAYSLREGSDQIPTEAVDFELKQGVVEASNVNVIDSMVELIRFQRNYELNQKAATSSDETLQKAVTEIGRI